MSDPNVFVEAFNVFLWEAGARINDYVGEPSHHPATEVLSEAARAIAPEVLVGEASVPDVEDPAVVAVLEQELVAQALEQLWEDLIAPKVRTPASRARFLLWAEEQAGRPFRLP